MRQILLGTLALAAISSTASAATLFTTASDFAGWTNTTPILTASSATSLDNNLTNGAGNPVAPNTAGTSGSLSVSRVAPTTYSFFYGPGQQDNPAFFSALGSTLTGANTTSRTLTASTGQIQFDYTTPPAGTGTYFEINVVLNYDGNFTQLQQGVSVDNGNGTSTRTFTYSINAVANLTYFQLGLIYNSNFDTATPFTVDNIRTPAVPEPMLLGSLAGAGLLMLRRRK